MPPLEPHQLVALQHCYQCQNIAATNITMSILQTSTGAVLRLDCLICLVQFLHMPYRTLLQPKSIMREEQHTLVKPLYSWQSRWYWIRVRFNNGYKHIRQLNQCIQLEVIAKITTPA